MKKGSVGSTPFDLTLTKIHEYIMADSNLKAKSNPIVTSETTNTQVDLLSLSSVVLALDTEFTTKSIELIKELGLTSLDIDSLIFGELQEVLAISGYSPTFDKYLYSDSFSENYNPIIELLQQLKYNVEAKPVSRAIINNLLTKYFNRYKKRSTKKALEALKKDKVLRVELENYGIDIKNLELEVRRKNNRSIVCFKRKTITFKLIFFFAFADLFKSFGRKWQWLFKDEALLTQFRTIKMQGISRFGCVVNGTPIDIKIEIFDTRYVFPPRKASLDGQVKTFGIDEKLGSKVKISEAIRERYGDEITEQWCKKNMDIVKSKYPDIFKEYALQDARLTWELYTTLVEMKMSVGQEFGLEGLPNLRETCGKNIEDFLFNLIFNHFGELENITSENSEELNKEILELYKLGSGKHISKLYDNAYGYIPTSTVGGLLFTRMVSQAIAIGVMLDLDLSSCYASALTQMNLYIGEPIFTTYHFNKPKLFEALDEIKELGVKKDAYYIRVSGKLNNAWNSLLLSDLKFNKKYHILEDFERYIYDEGNQEKDTVNLIDAKKPNEPTENCKLFTKEINHAIITQATLTAIQDLPPEWIDEYLNLEVDAVCYYHPDYIFDTVSELLEAQKELPSNPVKEEIGDSCLKIVSKQVYKNNACLKFPIATYYQNIKKIRKELKEKKVPIQEIYKLILNSTYGILASFVMKSNNPVAANWITSCARGAAWRMVLSLNGFAPITDGTSLIWFHIPTNKTLHEIIAKNPRYLIEFDESIINSLKPEDVLSLMVKNKPNTKGFNEFYKDNLKRFLGKTDWLIEMFDYELKDEENQLTFNNYYNTGAGNYIKKGEWGETFKCRSYQAVPELVEWYKKACAGKYSEHFISMDREIVKLSQGSLDAIHILQDADTVANDEKFRLGMLEDTAEQISLEGICHPMGFAVEKFKLMKLISPSQFNCENLQQYKALLCLCHKCGNISKELLTGNWISELDEDYLSQFKAYGINGKIITPEVDEALIKHYHQMNKQSPIGLGLELLIYGSESLKTITDVRVKINQLLKEYKTTHKGEFDLKNQLAFTQRILPRLNESKYLKHLFAATTILKTNAKANYIQLLANSPVDPMQRVVFLGDVKQLRKETTPKWAF